jgi:hypothetical protein
MKYLDARAGQTYIGFESSHNDAYNFIRMIWDDVPLDAKKQVVAYLHLGDIEMLSCTRSSERNLCQWEIHHRIASTLAAFEIESVGFLATLRRRSAVVEGSAAVAVFTAGSIVPRDLNIFVPCGSLEVFASDIRSLSGPDRPYGTVSYIAKAPNYLERGINQTIVLAHNSTGALITVSESLSSQAVIPILLSPSTITMNYFSYSTFISAYPKLISRSLAMGNSLPQHTNYPDSAWASRYLLAGFRIVNSGGVREIELRHRCFESLYCTRTRRCLIDPGCLVMPFTQDFVDRSRLEESSVTWRLASVRACQWTPPRHGRLSAKVTPKLKSIAWDGSGAQYKCTIYSLRSISNAYAFS